jgi:putative nucleotidyltransferase with HDIG domain
MADELPIRWQHVQAVARRASLLSRAAGLDDQLIASAAWLHDIGYATPLTRTGFHPLDGARYLRDHGWGQQICALVAHHSDARRLAGRLGFGADLSVEFPWQENAAHDVLWAADTLIGPFGTPVTLEERVREIVIRYGESHVVAIQMQASRPMLEAAITRTARACAAGRPLPLI